MTSRFKTLAHPLALATPAALIAIGLAGCASYSSITEKRPRYLPITPVVRLIVAALHADRRHPEPIIGQYLDAASEASAELRARPSDVQARRDYNFAVGRIFEVLHDANLNPFNRPL